MTNETRFKTELILRVHPRSIRNRPYELERDLVYETDVLPSGLVIVPAGYCTDFASTPRWTWRIFPPGGKYRAAAVVHDWLVDESPHTCTSKQAARIFREAMTDLGVKRWRRAAMYRAVRMFGPRFKAYIAVNE